MSQASHEPSRDELWRRAIENRRRRQARHRQIARERIGRRAFLTLGGILTARFAYKWRMEALHSRSLRPSLSASDDTANAERSSFNPVKVERISIQGIPLYRTTIDLRDPETYLAIGLAKDAPQANSHQSSVGDEVFPNFVQRYSNAAAILSGTFFSQDQQKRVMGNMVSAGKFLKYSQWENYGTTLGILPNSQLELKTARIDGQPQWSNHWFSMTSGPRLLKEGKIWIAPKSEGFRDPHVLGVATRKAIGYPKGGDKLIIATFLKSLSLAQEARAMKALGCYEAMNLDGGSSVALAHEGKILLNAERPLTNVLVVYDAEHPAPPNVRDSWARFQQGERPQVAQIPQ